MKEMDIVIVGGSLAGLIHALVFKKLGHRVHILEKSSCDVLQSQAAGLQAGQEVQNFINEYTKKDKPYSMTPAANIIEVLNTDGTVINSIPVGIPMHLTTWNILFELFNYSLLDDQTSSLATYETDKLVQDVTYDGEKVLVAYTDTKTKISETLEADIVIAADGGHSTVRKTVMPETTPKYVGYVTWRGSVPERSVSAASKDILQDRVLLFRTGRGFAVSYHVPSEDGSLELGDRQYIWVWYEEMDEGSHKFNNTFTDVLGKKHFTTIPRGKMQPEVWAAKQEEGAALSKPFAELLQKTDDPFVSAIREFPPRQSVFHDGKLILVGDAYCLFRPHVGSSTNQAAMHALGFAEVFKGNTDLIDWERKSLAYATKMRALSKSFGQYCFTGKVPENLVTVIKHDDTYNE